MGTDTGVRVAARLILVDDRGHILLFLHEDGRGRRFWATPGGGVEPAETTERAARREAAEELGIDAVELRPLWTGPSEFMLGERLIHQTETFFLVERFSSPPGSDVAAIHEAEGIKEARWWPLAEIETTDAPVFPTDLAAMLRTHVVGFR